MRHVKRKLLEMERAVLLLLQTALATPVVSGKQRPYCSDWAISHVPRLREDLCKPAPGRLQPKNPPRAFARKRQLRWRPLDRLHGVTLTGSAPDHVGLKQTKSLHRDPMTERSNSLLLAPVTRGIL